MNEIEKAIFLQMVQLTVEKDPSLCRSVIDAATEGVKDFADKQKDATSQMAYKLVCILDDVKAPKSGKFGPFTTDEILELLEGFFYGTEGLKKLKEKFAKKP